MGDVSSGLQSQTLVIFWYSAIFTVGRLTIPLLIGLYRGLYELVRWDFYHPQEGCRFTNQYHGMG
jgi:hypothetical protein